VLQYVVGFASYLWPTIAIEQRVALGPLHRFLGLAVYGTGMAAAAVSWLGQKQQAAAAAVAADVADGMQHRLV
jgi:hypothetical protein